jgi:hypothetical protein
MDLPFLSILAVISTVWPELGHCSTVCCSTAGHRSRGKPYRHSPWFRFLPKWFHFMSLPGFTWIAAVTYFNRISMIYGSLLLRGTFFSVICDPTRYSNFRTNVNIYIYIYIMISRQYHDAITWFPWFSLWAFFFKPRSPFWGLHCVLHVCGFALSWVEHNVSQYSGGVRSR